MLPFHPDLNDVRRALLQDRRFLATRKGGIRSVGGLGNLMQRWAKGTKLPQCYAHGFGKAIAHLLAEAAAKVDETGTVTDHRSLGLVQRHTEAAGLEGMADSAIDKLIARQTSDRNLKTNYRSEG